MNSEHEARDLKAYCDNVSVSTVGGRPVYRLSGLRLPEGCSPESVTALLCGHAMDGYESRLLLSSKVTTPIERNWNYDGVVAGERWFACSWKVDPAGRNLRALLAGHLEAFKR